MPQSIRKETPMSIKPVDHASAAVAYATPSKSNGSERTQSDARPQVRTAAVSTAATAVQSASAAALQEATETAAQTAAEAHKGDRQAQRLEQKRIAASPVAVSPVSTPNPGASVNGNGQVTGTLLSAKA
jgi:hypothetical protein